MNTKSTTDLGLAAALVTNGYKLEELDKSDRKRVRFVFESSYEIDQAEIAYWNDTLVVSGRMMMESVKYLKNRLYA